MRTSLVVFLLAFAATAIAQDKPAANAPELDKDTQTRIRTERSAGGLGKITPEEKANANVGAGPHQHFRPDGAATREPREDPAKKLESGDAGANARRP
jgi:hypothetical protein